MPLRGHHQNHDEERSMRPITELSLAHIGTRITIHYQGNIITGQLTAIEAERETVIIGVFGTEQQAQPGRWDRIDVTIGGVHASVSPSAEWEEA